MCARVLACVHSPNERDETTSGGFGWLIQSVTSTSAVEWLVQLRGQLVLRGARPLGEDRQRATTTGGLGRSGRVVAVLEDKTYRALYEFAMLCEAPIGASFMRYIGCKTETGYQWVRIARAWFPRRQRKFLPRSACHEGGHRPNSPARVHVAFDALLCLMAAHVGFATWACNRHRDD